VEKLHIDIETYSDIDISNCGAYKYCESENFEILIVAFAFNDEDIEVVDLARGQELPKRFVQALTDPNIEKWAHNANFERICFNSYGIKTEINQWFCTAIKAAYCGFPMSLAGVSKAMNLQDKAKSDSGKKLIRYFCVPCKPTKVNGQRTRNKPEHDLDAWLEFIAYCVQDVEAEREVDNRLLAFSIPEFERLNYILDQQINDRGILVDVQFAKNAVAIDDIKSKELLGKLKELTGVENPNSPAQLKKWLSIAMNEEITTLAKGELPKLIKKSGAGLVSDVVNLRIKSSKTSIKKYLKVISCACADIRVRGLFQFYGASATGRWAGRLLQVQNLKRNYLLDLEDIRVLVKDNDLDTLNILFDDVSDILSQLIRTALIAKYGHIFAVADFSAIEARVIAWLAGESWRIDVFNTHGKIYEASASMMFGIPIEKITKGSDLRYKGKCAELALGYQGWTQALKNIGGDEMNKLSEEQLKDIVQKWRRANKKIVKYWAEIEKCFRKTMFDKKSRTSSCGKIKFSMKGGSLILELPSGRHLVYQDVGIHKNKFGKDCVYYMGMNQTTKKWSKIDFYGGKMVQNIVQAVARDLLAFSMLNLDKAGFDIVMHVHDESICEIPLENSEDRLEEMCAIMGQNPKWSEGLPLSADGYLTTFYKKD
jgi:DNA polymerase